MIKQFCDICEKSTKRNYVRQPLELRFTVPKTSKPKADDVKVEPGEEWKVKVIVLKDGGKPAEICKKCLLKIINETGVEPNTALPE